MLALSRMMEWTSIHRHLKSKQRSGDHICPTGRATPTNCESLFCSRGCSEEGLINGSKPNRAIYATKHMEEVGYLDQLTFGHPVKEGELYSLICGDFVAFGVDEEGEIASLPQETIDKLKETFADPSTGYKEYIHIKYGIEPDQYQFQNEHAAGDKYEKSTMSLAEAAKEARENSMALNHSKGNHDDSGSDIGKNITVM